MRNPSMELHPSSNSLSVISLDIEDLILDIVSEFPT